VNINEYEDKLKEQKNVLSLLHRNEPLTEKELDFILNLKFEGDEEVGKLYQVINDKLKREQPITGYERQILIDRVINMDIEERKKAQKSRDASYGHITRRLKNNEPLTGKTLELALELVDVIGDDEQSMFVRNIGTKLKTGQPLDEYEHHILVDVLLLHARLSI